MIIIIPTAIIITITMIMIIIMMGISFSNHAAGKVSSLELEMH